MFDDNGPTFFNGEVEGEIGQKIPPEKLPASFKQGKKGKMSLKPEYMTEEVLERALPKPVRAKKSSPRPIVWEKIVNDVYGKVIRIIDKNYGIGAGYVSTGPTNTECVPFQILFDTFDVYSGDQDCGELGKKLSDVMEIGDFIKFNGVHMETEAKDSPRDIKYMTTALIVAKTADDLKDMSIPATAARISSLDQVAPTKIENFKVVVGVMNSTKVNEVEAELLEDLRSGDVSANFSVSPLAAPISDVVYVSEESDDEVTVIGDDIEDDENAKGNILDDLKPNELRKLIMCYMEIVTKMAENKSKRKINIEEIAKSTKIEKDIQFFEDFFLYLGKQCRHAIKGVKVGHVFVTQAQVNMIKTRGIMTRQDLEKEDDAEPKEENICSLFAAADLRKILLNFMKVIQNTMTLEQLGKEGHISLEEVNQLLAEITKACRDAPRDDGKAKGIKMQNIFINATWVDKITKYNFKE